MNKEVQGDSTNARTLILICNHFPYGYGETFLANEFSYLNTGFDNLIVLSRTQDTVKTRNLPSNVKLLRLSPRSSLLRKLKIILLLIREWREVYAMLKREREVVKNIYSRPVTTFIKRKMLHDLSKAFDIRDYIEHVVIPIAGRDAVIYSYWQDASALAATLLKGRNLCSKVVSRAHRGDLYFYANNGSYLSFREYMSKHIDQLFFISDDGLRYQSNLLKKVYPSFMVSRLGTEKLSELYPKKKNDKSLIVSCSNIIAVKRIHLIIEALSCIKEKELHWIHFGDGTLGEPVRALAEEKLCDKPHITYEFKGNVKNELVHEFYAENNVDMFINVSESEGIPVSIMEAMSYGIPVIATNVGGTGEIVDSTCGCLMEESIDGIHLAEKIVDELSQEGKGQRAFEKWQRNYSAKENYVEFVSKLKNK